MKLSEIGEYARLGLLVENPIELSRAKRTEGDLCARFRDGRRLQMHGGHSDIHTFRRVFLTDEYRLRQGPWDTVLDLGGNIGCVALRVAQQARRVIVYEPDPLNPAARRRRRRSRARARARADHRAGRCAGWKSCRLTTPCGHPLSDQLASCGRNATNQELCAAGRCSGSNTRKAARRTGTTR